MTFNITATLGLGVAFLCMMAGVASPQQESKEATIGYPSVAAALKDLQGRPGVIFTTENRWTIATEASTYTIWSFAPPGYPAYPTAVKRQIVKENDGTVMKMSVLCEASKQACDDVVREFQQLNEKARQRLKSGPRKGP